MGATVARREWRWSVRFLAGGRADLPQHQGEQARCGYTSTSPLQWLLSLGEDALASLARPGCHVNPTATIVSRNVLSHRGLPSLHLFRVLASPCSELLESSVGLALAAASLPAIDPLLQQSNMSCYQNAEFCGQKPVASSGKIINFDGNSDLCNV